MRHVSVFFPGRPSPPASRQAQRSHRLGRVHQVAEGEFRTVRTATRASANLLRTCVAISCMPSTETTVTKDFARSRQFQVGMRARCKQPSVRSMRKIITRLMNYALGGCPTLNYRRVGPTSFAGSVPQTHGEVHFTPEAIISFLQNTS